MEKTIFGLCIKSIDYKENDKLLTIIAFGQGKIVASITGSKKPTSKMRMNSMPLAYGEYQILVRGSISKIIGASIEDNFLKCWSDFKKNSAAQIILEMLDKCSFPNQNIDNELKEALKAISLINYTETNPYIFSTWYIVKVFDILGIDIDDYDISAKEKAMISSLHNFELENLDSMDFDPQRVYRMLSLLGMVLEHSLNINIGSIKELIKSKNLEASIDRGNKKSWVFLIKTAQKLYF